MEKLLLLVLLFTFHMEKAIALNMIFLVLRKTISTLYTFGTNPRGRPHILLQ